MRRFSQYMQGLALLALALGFFPCRGNAQPVTLTPGPDGGYHYLAASVVADSNGQAFLRLVTADLLPGDSYRIVAVFRQRETNTLIDTLVDTLRLQAPQPATYYPLPNRFAAQPEGIYACFLLGKGLQTGLSAGGYAWLQLAPALPLKSNARADEVLHPKVVAAGQGPPPNAIRFVQRGDTLLPRRAVHWWRAEPEQKNPVIPYTLGTMGLPAFRLSDSLPHTLSRWPVGTFLAQNNGRPLAWRAAPDTASRFPGGNDAAVDVERLNYLLRPGELRRMRRKNDQRAAIRAFWLQAAQGDKATAAQLAIAYFRRAKLANRQYSDFRPGWQTDRGMLYIVLGPPDAINIRPEQEIWLYEANEFTQQPLNFAFGRRPTQLPGLYVLELKRRRAYQMPWSAMVEAWRSGAIAPLLD